jgi:uncharacterized repeat protein (TIGR03803 family)
MKRIVNELAKLNWGKMVYAVFVLCAATAVVLPARTFTTLHSFDGTDGGQPRAGLVQATNGDLYGTTGSGGVNNNAECSYFGTGCGTVFKITPSGTLTTLYSFCAQSGCTDGYYPNAGLVQATNGDLYGTTAYGPNCPGVGPGCGTVFKITPNGALTTLYSFGSQSGGGTNPTAGLVQASNGDFYGTTLNGGAGGNGTVFKITPSATLTTLYSFCSQSGCPDGSDPEAGLVQAANGDFYGTTRVGGTNSGGTVFRITPGGTLTTLYSFCSQSACTDGSSPQSALVQATNGDLYGTTGYGGNGYGTIFKITPSGELTTLYSLCSQSACTDGEYLVAALVQDTNGTFYGTTSSGGANGDGTVFSMSVGLGPFVETQTTSGKVGAAVKILGSDLTGATSVSFNGTAATFTVVSRYLITTTVPAGATTGKVQVVTPSGTLSSNVPFRVP